VRGHNGLMDVIDDLLENNRAYVARLGHGHLDVRPSLQLAIVTCMDSRLDVFSALGLEDGQAHILRNAGGVITDDGFRAELQEATGMSPSFAIESFSDVDEDVRQSIARVRHSPFLLHRDRVRGFVYDVDTGALREVEG
jgi:carbonic anhydrase